MHRLRLVSLGAAPLLLLLLQLLLLLLLASTTVTALHSAVPLTDRINRFLQWLPEKGVRLQHVSITSEGVMGGLGLKATADLKQNEVFASLPLSVLLSVEHVFLDEWSQQHLDALSDTEATAIYLGRMRTAVGEDKKSEWDPYIQLLPDDFSSFPLHYTEEQMGLLQASMVRPFTERRLNRARATYNDVLDDVVRAEVSWDAFLWGLSVLWSRSHGVRVRDQQGKWHKAAAFVPLADLINMAPGPIGSGGDSSSGSGDSTEGLPNVDCKTNDASTHFECFATRPISRGQELLVPYGAASPDGGAAGIGNGQLLSDYGFTLEHNPSDVVLLTTWPPRAPGEYLRADRTTASIVGPRVEQMREDLFRAVLTRRDPAPGANQTFQLRWPTAAQVQSSDPLAAFPSDLLQLARIHALDEGFVDQMESEARAGGGGLGSGARDLILGRLKQGVMLFPSHELASLGLIHSQLMSLLASYGTSLAEDEALLAALPSAPTATDGAALDDEEAERVALDRHDSAVTRFCLLLRMGEKRLLYVYTNMLSVAQHKLRHALDAENEARESMKQQADATAKEAEQDDSTLRSEL